MPSPRKMIVSIEVGRRLIGCQENNTTHNIYLYYTSLNESFFSFITDPKKAYEKYLLGNYDRGICRCKGCVDDRSEIFRNDYTIFLEKCKNDAEEKEIFVKEEIRDDEKNCVFTLEVSFGRIKSISQKSKKYVYFSSLQHNFTSNEEDIELALEEDYKK